MKSGSEAVVKDASGTIVGTTTLPTGETTNAVPEPAGGNDFTCTWRLSLSVPTSAFYTIQVSGHDIGTVSQTQIAASRPEEVVVSLDSLTG